ncbi:hypothetical protein CRE_17251 [Caenorhabditis remanei]|uniref:Uncharacterized protein n=1 Tax=Caenorhabditis remanei TaxID=31234 RepID=E3MAD4_CAERE|nr:hypothetical protein CRE_17251 [Caenorhabditis remanei]
MKLLIFLFFLLPTSSAAYMVGSFTVPKQTPIFSQADLLKALHKPGLLAWRFHIPPNSTQSSICLSALEPVARLAERRKADLSLRIQIDQDRNISMALSKCGLQSAVSSIIMQSEIIILPPNYFTVMSNVGLLGCRKIEKPSGEMFKKPIGKAFDSRLLMMIFGEGNTSGTISLNMLEYPNSAKIVMENLVIHYFYPLLLGILFTVIGCMCSSIVCCAKRRCVATCRGYKAWIEYSQLKVVYGHKGSAV